MSVGLIEFLVGGGLAICAFFVFFAAIKIAFWIGDVCNNLQGGGEDE